MTFCMVDAVVGAVIMVVATSSLLFAVEVAEQAFSESGRYPLNDSEREMLNGVLSDEQMNQFWADNLRDAPREVVGDD